MLEERQQVVGELVAVVVGRVRLDLKLLRGVPVRRELVKGRVDLLHRLRLGPWRPPVLVGAIFALRGSGSWGLTEARADSGPLAQATPCRQPTHQRDAEPR
jgi:hypothetical protein